MLDGKPVTQPSQIHKKAITGVVMNQTGSEMVTSSLGEMHAGLANARWDHQGLGKVTCLEVSHTINIPPASCCRLDLA